MKNVRPRFFASLLALAILVPPAAAHAKVGTLWVNPGVKIGYTFGEGVVLGFEISTVFFPDTAASNQDVLTDMTKIWGIVLNVDRTWDKFTKLRLGVEWIGPGIGLEAGPTLILDKEGPHFGIGVTPWFGFYSMPYYTYTYAFDRPNLHEIGTYLKLYKCIDVVPGQCGDDGDGSPNLD